MRAKGIAVGRELRNSTTIAPILRGLCNIVVHGIFRLIRKASNKNLPKKNIEKVVDAALDQVLEIDGRLMMDVVSVATALGALREALDKVDESLDKREFEKASSLGYNAVSSEFIFLQRTLGALQDSQYAKESLISEIALKSGSGIYEEVEPFVSKRMQSAQIGRASCRERVLRLV